MEVRRDISEKLSTACLKTFNLLWELDGVRTITVPAEGAVNPGRTFNSLWNWSSVRTLYSGFNWVKFFDFQFPVGIRCWVRTCKYFAKKG